MVIRNNYSLKNHNTFGIDCIAERYVSFDNQYELQLLLEQIKQVPFILGGGSNMLLVTPMIPTVFHNQIKGIKIIKEEDQYVLVEIGAGEEWHDLVIWAIENNYGGIENLSLIPGSVGAAPIQNIGAYGVELKDVFESLSAIHIEKGHELFFHNNECEFAYRDSVFKGALKQKIIITSVVLKLTKLGYHQFNTSYGAIEAKIKEKQGSASYGIKEISDAVIEIRRSKLPDPKVIGNSGSFFKNPMIPDDQFSALKIEYPDIPGYPNGQGETKVPAAWLLDQSGWKGKVVGNTGCYKNQPLVVVNHGNATGQEVLDFTKVLQASVKDKFGILLQAEVNLIES